MQYYTYQIYITVIYCEEFLLESIQNEQIFDKNQSKLYYSFVYFIPIITTKFAYFASINRSNFIVFLIDSLNIFLCTLLTQCLWKNKRILGSELSKELRDLHSNKKIGWNTHEKYNVMFINHSMMHKKCKEKT